MSDRIRADVAVIGGGPAGIAAAVRAAEAGRRVVLLDESARAGGQIWRHTSRGALPASARRWLDRLEASGCRVVGSTSVVDAVAGGRLTAEVAGTPLRVDAPALVLATGARELFLPFPGWTLPGVTGVGGAQALLKGGMPVRGRRVVVAGSGPLLLPVAAALASQGARVVEVAEQADRRRILGFAAGLWRTPGRLPQAAAFRAAFLGARYRTGAWVLRADGDDRVREATLTDGRSTWTERCDLLCVGFGLVPSTEIARLLGCDLRDRCVAVDGEQRTSVRGVWCAGEPTGIGGVDAALAEGQIAGLSAAVASIPAGLMRIRDRQRAFARRLKTAFALRPELRSLPDAGTVVCRCEDVTADRIQSRKGMRENKLLTRAGMGPCQGRVCGPALEFLYGFAPDSVRVPLLPTAVSTLIGEEPLSNPEESSDAEK